MNRTIMALAFAAGVVGTSGCGTMQYQARVPAHRHGVDVSHTVAIEREKTDKAIAAEAQARKENDQKLMAQLQDQQNDIQELEQKYGMQVSAVRGGGAASSERAGGGGATGGQQTAAREGLIEFAMPVNFETDSAKLNASDEPALAQFAKLVEEHYADLNLTIQGYTDPAGSKKHNEQLSQKRAEAVRDFLIGEGVDPGLVKAEGRGSANPVAPITRPCAPSPAIASTCSR